MFCVDKALNGSRTNANILDQPGAGTLGETYSASPSIYANSRAALTPLRNSDTAAPCSCDNGVEERRATI